MENVPNMMSMGKGIIKDQITQDFENLGYIVHSKILMASDFGVPQNRRRAFFVGFKKECNFEFPTPFATEKITAFEAISDLPDYSLNDGENYPLAIERYANKNNLLLLHSYNYPKYVITMDDFWQENIDGIVHQHIGAFLLGERAVGF